MVMTLPVPRRWDVVDAAGAVTPSTTGWPALAARVINQRKAPTP